MGTYGSTQRRNPRVRAAMCYAVPFVPASVLLVRERRNRFVRFHAAQALLFFVAVVVVQLLLYAALVVLGNVVMSLWQTVALFAVFLALLIGVGVFAFGLWLRLLRQCMDGRMVELRVLGGWAKRLERLTWRPRHTSDYTTAEKNPSV